MTHPQPLPWQFEIKWKQGEHGGLRENRFSLKPTTSNPKVFGGEEVRSCLSIAMSSLCPYTSRQDIFLRAAHGTEIYIYEVNLYQPSGMTPPPDHLVVGRHSGPAEPRKAAVLFDRTFPVSNCYQYLPRGPEHKLFVSPTNRSARLDVFVRYMLATPGTNTAQFDVNLRYCASSKFPVMLGSSHLLPTAFL